jgi:hypothetical protein
MLALDANGQSVSDPVASDGSGNYVLTDVPAGSWTVEFFPDQGCGGVATGEAFQFYAGRSTPASADLVTVVADETTKGIDATLAEAAQITGNVTDVSGNTLPGVCAVLEDTSGRPVLRQLTNQRGDYFLDQLPAGQFILQFVADGCVGAAERYAAQYYPGAATRSGASTITLSPGDLRGGLDAVLAPAPGGGDKNPWPPPPAGGGGSSGGGSSSRSTPRRAHIVLLAGSRQGYLVDHRGRLHLRLRCERPGPTCAGSIKLALLARGARRTGRIVGYKAFRLRADRRGHTILVRVRTKRPRLRLLIHLHEQAGSQVITTVRVRYPRAVKRRGSGR